MIHGPLNYNLDTDESKAKLFDLEEKQRQANMTEAQKEQEGYGTDKAKKKQNQFATPDAFEAWVQKQEIQNATAWDGKSFAKPQNAEVDFNTVNGQSVEGPSSPATLPTEGLDWGAGGLTALQQAPGIIANLGTEVDSQGGANAKLLNSTAQFAQIGMSVGGPWGAAIGGVAGFIGGALSSSGWFDKKLEKEDRETLLALEQDKKDRMRDYVKGKTQDELKAQADIYAQALGYSNRTYNT